MMLSAAELETLVREERPSIDEEFAAMLDERAARGFPRAKGRSPFAGLVDRMRTVPPRRILVPAGAVATLLVVVAVSITTLGGIRGSGSSSSGTATTRSEQAPPSPTPTTSAPANATRARGAAPTVGQLKLENAPAASAPAARKVAQNAQLTLSTNPDQVRNVADQVTQVARRYHGLVISSRITSGKGRPAPPVPLPETQTFPVGPSLGADFQLRIPASKLEPA